MAFDPERPYWVDCLYEKHECFSYGDSATMEVSCAGKALRVILPDYLADASPLVVSLADSMLFIFARSNRKQWEGEHFGIVMVAKHRDGDTYEVGVWHELYPWALKHFGHHEGRPQS